MAIPWLRSQASVNQSNQTVVTTAETAIATLPGISLNDASESIYLRGSAIITIGTAGVTAELQVRRGNGITGSIVSVSKPVTVTAAAVAQLAVECIDTPGHLAGGQYTLTVTVASASGNSTVALASLYAAY